MDNKSNISAKYAVYQGERGYPPGSGREYPLWVGRENPPGVGRGYPLGVVREGISTRGGKGGDIH